MIALYARGLTVREIQRFLLETYGTEVSADFIGSITDGIQAEVTAWQNRRGPRQAGTEKQAL